jgi:hypothetical protein
MHYPNCWFFICLDQPCCSAQWHILDEVVAYTNNINLAKGMCFNNSNIFSSKASIASSIN